MRKLNIGDRKSSIAEIKMGVGNICENKEKKVTEMDITNRHNRFYNVLGNEAEQEISKIGNTMTERLKSKGMTELEKVDSQNQY